MEFSYTQKLIPQAAERELIRLRDASPDNAKPYFMLGRIYKAKGERVKALHNFTTALSLDPKARYESITIRRLIQKPCDQGSN